MSMKEHLTDDEKETLLNLGDALERLVRSKTDRLIVAKEKIIRFRIGVLRADHFGGSNAALLDLLSDLENLI